MLDRFAPQILFEQPEGAAAEPPPAVEPEQGGESAWAGPSQQDWEATQEALMYLASVEQQRAAVYQPREGQDKPTLDPFAEDFGQQLVGLIRQELTPYQQFQQDAQLGEAEERAMDILHDLSTRDGEFDVDVARIRADSLLPAMQERYGFGPQAAEAALQQAAADQRDYEQKLLQRGGDIRVNHIKTLAGAEGEPGSTFQVGVQQRTMPDYTQGGRVTDRLFGNAREG